jgi:hypothetical protein
MHASYKIIYAYTVVLRQNLRENPDFYAKNAVRLKPFYPVQFGIRPVSLFV